MNRKDASKPAEVQVRPIIRRAVRTPQVDPGIMASVTVGMVLLAVLFLCFPVEGPVWMGLAAVIGAALPVPRA